MTRAQKRWLAAAVLCATASGLAIPTFRDLCAGDDLFSIWRARANAAWSVHLFAAAALLVVLGWLLEGHVLPRWNGLGAPVAAIRAARPSGIAVAALALAMASSGIALQTWSSAPRPVLAWVHGAAGSAFALALIWHARKLA
jgi:hypothetical protein